MTTAQLIDNTIPQLSLDDTVEKALQLMNDFKINHVPVVLDENFLGLLSESDLLDAEDTSDTLDLHQHSLIPAATGTGQHFLKAVAISNLYQTNIIPVINEANDLIGCISSKNLLNELGNFSGASEYGALVVLEMERSRFAISELNSIVESDGAVILHLNTVEIPGSQTLQVTLQINKKEISTIIATFERYEYSIIFYAGEEQFENDIDTNYRNLMNYLDI